MDAAVHRKAPESTTARAGFSGAFAVPAGLGRKRDGELCRLAASELKTEVFRFHFWVGGAGAMCLFFNSIQEVTLRQRPSHVGGVCSNLE